MLLALMILSFAWLLRFVTIQKPSFLKLLSMTACLRRGKSTTSSLGDEFLANFRAYWYILKRASLQGASVKYPCRILIQALELELALTLNNISQQPKHSQDNRIRTLLCINVADITQPARAKQCKSDRGFLSIYQLFSRLFISIFWG
jgi:hypothetical protein